MYLHKEDEERAQEMAKLVRADLEKQYHILRGQDQHGQVVMIKYPRTGGDTSEESYVLSQIYMAERSTAATQVLALGRCERSIAVYNYLGFDRSMSPPFAMQVTAAVQMQKVYPERLQVRKCLLERVLFVFSSVQLRTDLVRFLTHVSVEHLQTLVMVEPPFWLRGAMGLLKPFLSDSITERIKWASGLDERDEVFANQLGVATDQATPLMRKDAQLTSPVSLDHFLMDTPFCYVYDSVPCKRDVTAEEEELHKIAHTMPEEGPSIASQASSLWGSLATSFSSFGADEEKSDMNK